MLHFTSISSQSYRNHHHCNNNNLLIIFIGLPIKQNESVFPIRCIIIRRHKHQLLQSSSLTSSPLSLSFSSQFATLSCKTVGKLRCFKTCQLHFLYFVKVDPLPHESVLFNVSFHTKTSNRRNNIESGEGDFKKTLTLIFLREEYQMSKLILQLNVACKETFVK